MHTDSADPHGATPVAHAGAPFDQALAAVILVHGRGGSAEDILSLAPVLGDEIPGADRIAWSAPQASGHTWYPFSFLAPVPQNEPGITSGIDRLERLVSATLEAGIPAGSVILGGFSQGACLALEFAARHPRRYGALLGFSGGLIGPQGTPRDYAGSLEGTPVFLGCSDIDPHIPAWRVDETAEVFTRMGAVVDRRLYRGMGHTINEDELDAARGLLRGVLARTSNS